MRIDITNFIHMDKWFEYFTVWVMANGNEQGTHRDIDG
jgi:hypothetical protein